MRISDWSSDVCSSDLQFPGEGREHLAIDTTSAEWRAAAPGAELLGLYRDDRYPEDIVMLRLPAGSRLPPQMIDAAAAPHGLEIFVVSGGLVADGARYAAGAWLRAPHGIAKHLDRQSGVSGKSVSVRGDRGGRRSIEKKKIK